MEGLFSFLLFAVFFYFMMRHGCGAHTTHGNHDKKSEKNSVIDPVCGHKVEDDQGYGKLQDGHLYRFCSKECLDSFDLEPEKFVGRHNISSIKSKGNDHES